MIFDNYVIRLPKNHLDLKFKPVLLGKNDHNELRDRRYFLEGRLKLYTIQGTKK